MFFACRYMLRELKKREGFEMVVDEVSYNYHPRMRRGNVASRICLSVIMLTFENVHQETSFWFAYIL